MIENYNDVIEEWGCCSQMMTIEPSEDMHRWAVQKTVTILANADYYYTKKEVDKLLEDVTHGGVTREEVEQMIQNALTSKADQTQVDEIARQVTENASKILNTYTKDEVNSLMASYLTKIEAIQMRDNYSRVDGNTIILNNEYEITL